MWQSIKLSIDMAQFRPIRADNIVSRELADRTGTYYVLKNAERCAYLRLSPREFWLWQQMDGTRSVKELIVAYFIAHGTFALDLVVDLISQLSAKYMLGEPPQFVFASINRALERRGLIQRLSQPAQALLTREWSITNLDSLITRLYGSIGWLFYTRPAQLLYLLISVIGLLLFSRVLAAQHFAFVRASIGIDIILLWLASVLPIAIHELGHALTVKHYGRNVDRGGVMLFYGAPAAFIDTSDIWMEGKSPRLAVTWAGPYTGFILGGLCTLMIWLRPEGALAPLLFQVGVVSYTIAIVNLNPLLKLDGYYLLSDALEIPRLRERSLAFVRRALLPKLHKRERFSREELFFVVFGLLAILWTAYTILMSMIIWNAMASEELGMLWSDPASVNVVVTSLLTLFFGGSLLAWLGFLGYNAARKALDLLRRSGALSDPGQLGLVASVGALTLACGLGLLASEARWLSGILGSIALVSVFVSALALARSLRGAPIAVAAWVALAGSIVLLLPAQIMLIQWSGNAALIRALDSSSLVLAGLALALGWPIVRGLAGSWRATSVIVLALGWMCLIGVLIVNAEPQALIMHTLACLLLGAGVGHWCAFRLPAVIAVRYLDAPHTARGQLQEACTSLVTHLLDAVCQAYGEGMTRRICTRLDRHADAHSWRIRIVDGRPIVEALPDQLAATSIADLAETLIPALTALLHTITRFVGTTLLQRALTRSYDALPWEHRELLGEYVLHDIPIAAGLVKQYAQMQRDVLGLLAHAPLFASFTPDELRVIGAALRPKRFARGATIIRQGEPGDRFYLVRRGRVSVSQRDSEGSEHTLHDLVRGDYFGETALLTGAPRNATIHALTPVEALVLSRDDFDRLLRAGFGGQRKIEHTVLREGLLRRIPLFRDFGPAALRQLVMQLASETLAQDTVVFRQGDIGDRFYIVERGEVAVQLRISNGQVIEQGRLGPGEYFGEIALLMDVPRTATIVATQPTRLLCLHSATFNTLVRDSIDALRLLQRTSSRRVLANSNRDRRSATDVPVNA